MKKLLLITFSISSTLVCFSQQTDSTKYFTFVEKMPEFPFGNDSLQKFISQNIQYPQMELDNLIEGMVNVQFIVEKDGSLSNIKIEKKVSAGLDKEAIRIIKKLPLFNAGTQQGEKVRVQYNIGIDFKLPLNSNILPLLTKKKRDEDEDFRAGYILFERRDYKGALPYFKKSVRNKSDAITYKMMADCYGRIGEGRQMCNFLELAIQSGYKDAANDYKLHCK